MPFAVLPALIADVGKVYDVYFAAFQDELITKLLYPNGVDREAHKQGTIQWWTHDQVTYTVKCVDQATGEVVGMASWEIYWEPDGGNRWKRPLGIPWLEGKDKERCESVLAPMWDMRQKLFGEKRHIYLLAMAVHPSHQRRGAGRLLVQWGVDMAERLGLPIYAESSHSGLPLYQAMGFQKLAHVKLSHKAELVEASEDLEVPLVVRMPSVAKDIKFEDWANKGFPEAFSC